MKLHSYTVTIPGGRLADGTKRPEQTYNTVAVNPAHALGNVRSMHQRALKTMELPKWFLLAKVTRS